ncbi:MAG: hypothetical protein QOE33_1788 [Acidobacteriota bacterium]|nr:hypothetical protein [Acidobacteriota bacterium]
MKRTNRLKLIAVLTFMLALSQPACIVAGYRSGGGWFFFPGGFGLLLVIVILFLLLRRRR